MKNKQTKKRVGVLAVMLMLIVAIGATAGTTLAKYISSATIDSQSATVAKWGYTLSTQNELFSSQYGNVQNNLATSVENGTIVVKAESDARGDIVAPGTTGSMTITFMGTAEVDAVLKINVNEFETIYLANNEQLTNAYYPIKWGAALGANATITYGEATTKAAFATAIKTALEGTGLTVAVDDSTNVISVNIPANANQGTGTEGYDIKLTIGWKWDFESTGNVNDANDTRLGYLAAIGSTYDSKLAGVKSQNEVLFTDAAAYTAYYTYSKLTVKAGLALSIEQVQGFAA